MKRVRRAMQALLIETLAVVALLMVLGLSVLPGGSGPLIEVKPPNTAPERSVNAVEPATPEKPAAPRDTISRTGQRLLALFDGKRESTE